MPNSSCFDMLALFGDEGGSVCEVTYGWSLLLVTPGNVLPRIKLFLLILKTEVTSVIFHV